MNRIWKFTLLTGVMLLAFMASTARLEAQNAPAPAANIGVFNLQTAINNSKRGQQARDGLAAKYEKMEKELKATEASLDKKSQDLKKQASALSREALEKKQNDMMAEVQAFRAKVQSYTEEMQKAEAEALQPLFDEAFKIAENLGKSKGFIMVIEAQKAGVIYCLDSMDLTAEVVKALDAAKKK